MSNLKSTILGVCILFSTAPATANPPVKLDYPMFSRMGHQLPFNSWLDVNCRELTTTGSRRIACLFRQTIVSQLSPEEVANKVAETSSIGKEMAQDAAKDPKMCQSISAEGLDTTVKDIISELKTSCIKKDAVRASAALTRYVLEIEAKTCTIDSWGFEREFSQVDQNTWVTASPQPYGICNLTSVITLWKDPGESASLWNYKSISSVPPNAPEHCDGVAAEPIKEYSWKWAFIPRLADCKYITM